MPCILVNGISFIIGLEIGCREFGSRYVCKISNFRFLRNRECEKFLKNFKFLGILSPFCGCAFKMLCIYGCWWNFAIMRVVRVIYNVIREPTLMLYLYYNKDNKHYLDFFV